MNRQHAWSSSLAFGDKAAEEVAQALRAQGSAVINLTKLPAAQRRGVDYLVDDEYVDIKADTHAAECIFLELECKNETGCFFKSRADAWLYYFPRERLLYRLDLPRLQHHIARNLDKYKQRSAWSTSGTNAWMAVGAIVPLADLIDLGIAQDVSHVMSRATQPNSAKTEAAV